MVNSGLDPSTPRKTQETTFIQQAHRFPVQYEFLSLLLPLQGVTNAKNILCSQPTRFSYYLSFFCWP